MKNTIGKNVCLTIFGESHGDEIGVVIDGLAPGIKINKESIDLALSLRRPSDKISTPRVENDEYHIISGVFNDFTTGGAICILVKNENKISKDYSDLKIKPRPSHSDYVAEIKYNGYQDYRGGGFFSGRITAGIVAAGAIARDVLKNKGIYVGSHIKNIKGIEDDSFKNTIEEIELMNTSNFPVLNKDIQDRMRFEILKARENLDSVGGIIETEILGLEVGVGEPYFSSIESKISEAIFSIPAVKGIEFGEGFNFANLYGSEANDEFMYVDKKVITTTNNNGGINGGISNGMPIIFKTVIKPTPSIGKCQNTINLETGTNTSLEIKGRHDPCIVHRARIVIDSMTCLVLLDLISEKNANDWMK